MNKKNLIDKISEDLGENKGTVEKIFNSIFANLGNTIKEDKTFQVSGFGTFKISERKARQGINPKTREKIQIEASKSISFKPSKNLKENLKK